jgi:hypothetical protein
MATLNYRIHTNMDPMSREGVHFLTRGRRPTMRDYEAWSRTLPASWGIPRAIFEFEGGWFDNLAIDPVYEVAAHKVIRLAWAQKNEEQGSRMNALYQAKAVSRRVKRYLNEISSSVKSASDELQGMAVGLDVQGLSLATHDPLEVRQFSNTLNRMQRNMSRDSIAESASELAYALGGCAALIPEMVAADPHEETCERPKYVVWLGTEEYGAAQIACEGCGHVVPPLGATRMPSRESLLGEDA